MDFISRYGFLSNYYCSAGKYQCGEEWAEAFSFYVTAGKNFRTAALQNSMIAQKYNWLKDNVFQGIEFDTDLIAGLSSGRNDVPGCEGMLPGYVSCSEDYVWDGQLRKIE